MIVAPSILACDLGRLADEIRAVERGGARMIHVDVMDGRFVPNITFGPVVVKACRQATQLPVDAHLMIADAEPYLDAFADAGATSISVHVEAVTHLQRATSEGVPVSGYFLWSLMDNFEWSDGLQKRFGLHLVDFDTRRRTPKLSASFYRETIRQNAVA